MGKKGHFLGSMTKIECFEYNESIAIVIPTFPRFCRGRKKALSFRELFSGDPFVEFEKLAGIQLRDEPDKV